MPAVFAFLAERPIILLLLLVGIGAALGRIRIGGISFGAIGVLFAAMGITAWGTVYGVGLEIPQAVGDLGLVVFAFCVGMVAGPGFFHALRSAWPLMLVVTGILIAAAATAYGLGRLIGLDVLTIAGIFAGAVTNTPALAATGGSPAATVGYASAYVFGVVGVIIAVVVALRHRDRDTDAPIPIVDKLVEIDHPATAKDIAGKHGDRVAFGRLRDDAGTMTAVGPDTRLPPGGVVNVVGPRDAVEEVAADLGHTSAVNIIEDRSQVDFRRIILSNARLSGRTVASLGLRDRYASSIVRVRRGDIEFAGTGDFVLHQGDRLRVVGPPSQLPAVTEFLGDSERGMADINPAVAGLGIAIGLMLAVVPIPLPGGGTFSFGYAAGALVIGLVLGRVGRIGPVVTSLPNTSANVLAEFGLHVFLAFAGTKAGSLIIPAIVSGDVLHLMAVGAAVTTVVVAGTYLVVRYLFRSGGTRLSGILGGAQTNPAILGFANVRTQYDVRVALGYSLVYPAAMVVKILLAQVLVTL